MGMNFPDLPTNGQVFGVYTYDGEKWVMTSGPGGITQADADLRYVNVTGDTMTGALRVNAGVIAAETAVAGTYWFGASGTKFFNYDGTTYTLGGGPVNVIATTASTSPTTGALTVAGGVGVNGAINTPTPAQTDKSTNVPTTAWVKAWAAPFDALACTGMQINGSMEVSQENGANPVAVAGTKYILDGFQCVLVGSGTATGTQTAIASLPGFSYCLNFNCATVASLAGAGDVQYVICPIEGYRWARLGFGTATAQPVTIGFWVYPTVAGTLAVSLRNGPVANRSYVVDVPVTAATWQYKTVTIPGDVAGTWVTNNGAGAILAFCFGSGSSFKTPANAWTAGNLFATPATSNFFAATGVNLLTGVVVLPGTEAPSAARSPLIMRPYDQELLTCMRYFEKSYDYATAIGAATLNGAVAYLQKAASAVSTAGNGVGFRFRLPKRAAPTVSIWSTLGVGGAMSYSPAGGGFISIGVNVAGIGENGVQGVYTTGGSGMTVNQPIETAFHYIADARL